MSIHVHELCCLNYTGTVNSSLTRTQSSIRLHALTVSSFCCATGVSEFCIRWRRQFGTFELDRLTRLSCNKCQRALLCWRDSSVICCSLDAAWRGGSRESCNVVHHFSTRRFGRIFSQVRLSFCVCRTALVLVRRSCRGVEQAALRFVYHLRVVVASKASAHGPEREPPFRIVLPARPVTHTRRMQFGGSPVNSAETTVSGTVILCMTVRTLLSTGSQC